MRKALRQAAFAALLLAASPVAAFTPSLPDRTSAAISDPLARTVDRFYAERDNAPIWFRYGASSIAASRLIGLLDDADLDGLAAGPQLASNGRAVIEAARFGDEHRIAEAERMLSAAWLLYRQALHAPASGILYGDPAIIPRAPRADEILQEAAEAPSLAEHIEQMAEVNPIYAELRRAAVAAGELSPHDRARVRANLERARVLPAGGRFILVDVASGRLTMVEEGREVDSMRVIVGKSELPTPLIASRVVKATFNPYWNVPPDLVRNNIATKAVAEGTGFFAERGYEVLSSWTNDAVQLDPEAINWQSVADGDLEVRVRQLPGPRNMMGSLKFAFPNGRGIYLHDTPDKSLFDEEQRTFSSGCVRLEDARRLGRWLLGREPVAPSAQPELHVELPKPVPVYLTYFTARVESGQLAFADDVYGLEDGHAARLAGR